MEAALEKPLRAWKKQLQEKAIDSTRLIFSFGLVLFINYPLFYFIWGAPTNTITTEFFLRIIASALCIPLIFNKFIPVHLKHWLIVYWYIVASYCLPFFFSYMLLKNHFDPIWLMNSVSAMFFILLVFDIISSLFLIFLGVSISCAIYYTNHGSFDFPTSISTAEIFLTFLAALIIGGIFSRNKQVLEIIKRRSIKAEANSRAKSEFIANMSHDLRTPITGIMGMAQDLADISHSTQEKLKASSSSELGDVMNSLLTRVKEDSSLLMGATNELLNLCNEILEIIQIESGKPSQDHKACFSIEKVIKHNIKLLKPVANHKNLSLHYSIDSNVPQFVEGMDIYFDRTVLNLISNALKFTEEGGVTVKVSMAKQQNNDPNSVNLDIKVQDTGIGIPEDKFDVIFENFSRLTPSYEGNYKGAGLGLFSVKQYINTMEGNVYVESEVNKGTCFTVRLPFTISDHEDSHYTSTIINLPRTPEMSLSGMTSETKGNQLARVLVVEDNTLAAKAVISQLDQLGCSVDWAKTGKEAVNQATKNQYDLVFMDVGLPDFSGVEATIQIRQVKSGMPIIGLTGHASEPEKRQECINAGMQEVLNKPAHKTILHDILSSYIPDFSCRDTINTLANKESDSLLIIDWDGCVEAFEGEDFAKEMLMIFAKDIKDSESLLEKSYESNDISSLRDELHKLRGGVCYLKLPELEATLKNFHNAIKSSAHSSTKTAESQKTFNNLKLAIRNFLREYEKY